MTTREFQQKKPLSILFTYFKPHRGLFILDLVCATVVALIDLAFPLVTRKSMYDLLPNQQYRTFFIVMGVMMAAFIVRALLYYVISYSGHTFGILVEEDIRRDLFTHVQELDVSLVDHNRTGQLMSRLTSDLFEITELAHHGPEDLLISTLTIVGALAILFSIEWRLALVVACILPVFIAVIMSRRSKMTAASRGEKPPSTSASSRRSPASARRAPLPTRKRRSTNSTRRTRNSRSPSANSTTRWVCSTRRWSFL